MANIIMYTDGAAKGNPGRGGYGVVLMSEKYRKEISQGYKYTTNNRMELLAVIVGLEAMKKSGNNVTIYSDSKYVVDSINKKWIYGWVKKDFAGKKNPDLWKRYIKIAKNQNIKIIWIKGHANIKENEVCDKLAVKASFGLNLKEDTGYINAEQSQLNL